MRVSAKLRPHFLLGYIICLTAIFIGYGVALGDSDGWVNLDVLAELRSVVDRTGQLAVVALGCVLVRCCGRLDLSVGATFLIAMSVMRIEGNAVVLAACGIVAGLVIGLSNGVLVATSRHSSTLITLLTMCFLCGMFRTAFSSFMTDGFMTEGFMTTGFVTEGFTAMGPQEGVTGRVGGNLLSMIRVQDAVVILMYVAGYLLLMQTQPGRNFVVVGHGLKRAKLLGINVNLYLWIAFGICGLLAAIAGTFNTGSEIVAPVTVVHLLPLQAFAAIAIGQGDLRMTTPRLSRILLGCFLLLACGAARKLNHWPPECDTLMSTLILLIATLLPRLDSGFDSSADLSNLNDSSWIDGS